MASPGKVSSRGRLQGVLKAPKNIPGSRTPGPAAVRPPAANARPSMSPQLLTTFINSSGANEAGSTSAGSRQRNVDALSDIRLRTENVEIGLRQTETELRALKKLVSNLTKQNQDQQAVRNGRLRVPNTDVPTRILMRYIVPRVDVAYTSDTICID